MVIVGSGLRLMVGFMVGDGVTYAVDLLSTGTAGVIPRLLGFEEVMKDDGDGTFSIAPGTVWQAANPNPMTHNPNQYFGDKIIFINDAFYGVVWAIIALLISAAKLSVPRGLIWIALLVNSIEGTRSHSSRQLQFSAWQV